MYNEKLQTKKSFQSKVLRVGSFRCDYYGAAAGSVCLGACAVCLGAANVVCLEATDVVSLEAADVICLEAADVPV